MALTRVRLGSTAAVAAIGVFLAVRALVGIELPALPRLPFLPDGDGQAVVVAPQKTARAKLSQAAGEVVVARRPERRSPVRRPPTVKPPAAPVVVRSAPAPVPRAEPRPLPEPPPKVDVPAPQPQPAVEPPPSLPLLAEEAGRLQDVLSSAAGSVSAPPLPAQPGGDDGYPDLPG